MINSMKKFGIKKVYLMPDNYCVNANIASIANKDSNSNLEVEILDMIPTDQPDDTIKSIRIMKDLGIKCLIVMGGDGTCRLAAKANIDIPVIAVSTGTNNVYPQHWEGTTVGIAAAYIALRGLKNFPQMGKKIEVYINDKLSDIAIVDAAVTRIPYIGSKIVTQIDDIDDLIVCRCSPDLIGLSAIIGSNRVCEDDDDFGYYIKISANGNDVLTAISAGQIDRISYSELGKIDLGCEHAIKPAYDGSIALDGERTVPFRSGDHIKFVINRNAPYKVDVKNTLYEALENGFFR